MFEIIPLQGEHLEDAAALVRSSYNNLSEKEPLLPSRYQETHNLTPLLQNILDTACPGGTGYSYAY